MEWASKCFLCYLLDNDRSVRVKPIYQFLQTTQLKAPAGRVIQSRV